MTLTLVFDPPPNGHSQFMSTMFFFLVTLALCFNFNFGQNGCTSGRCNRQYEFTLLHFTIFH